MPSQSRLILLVPRIFLGLIGLFLLIQLVPYGHAHANPAVQATPNNRVYAKPTQGQWASESVLLLFLGSTPGSASLSSRQNIFSSLLAPLGSPEGD